MHFAKLPLILFSSAICGIVGPRQPGLNGHDPVRIEPGLHFEQVPKLRNRRPAATIDAFVQ